MLEACDERFLDQMERAIKAFVRSQGASSAPHSRAPRRAHTIVILGLDTGGSEAEMPEKMQQFSSKLHQEEAVGVEDGELASMFEYKQVSKDRTLLKGLELLRLTGQIRIDLKVQAVAARVKRLVEGDLQFFRGLVEVKLKGLVSAAADRLAKAGPLEQGLFSKNLLSKCPAQVACEEPGHEQKDPSELFAGIIGTLVDGGKKRAESRASHFIRYFKVDRFINDRLVISPNKRSPEKLPVFTYLTLKDLDEPKQKESFAQAADFSTPQKKQPRPGHVRDKTGGSGMTDLFSVVESPASHRFLVGDVAGEQTRQEQSDDSALLEQAEVLCRKIGQAFADAQDDYFGNASRGDDLLFLVEIMRDNLDAQGFPLRKLALELLIAKAQQMQTLAQRLMTLQIVPQEREPLHFQLEAISEQLSILHLELPAWQARQNPTQARSMVQLFKQMVDLNLEVRLVLTQRRPADEQDDLEFDESLEAASLEPPSPAKMMDSILALFWSKNQKSCQFLSVNLGIVTIACRTLHRLLKFNKSMRARGRNIRGQSELIETLFLFLGSTIVNNEKTLTFVEKELGEILDLELSEDRQEYEAVQSIESSTNGYFLLYLLTTQHANLVQRTEKHKGKLDLIFNLLPKLDDRDYRKSLLLGSLMNHKNDVNDIRTRAFHTEVCNRLAFLQSQTFPSILKADRLAQEVHGLQAKASHSVVFLEAPNSRATLLFSEGQLNYLLAYVELLSYATQGKNVLTEQLSQNIFGIQKVKQLLPVLAHDFLLLQAVLSYLKNTFIEVEKEPSQAILDAFKDIYLILFEQLKGHLAIINNPSQKVEVNKKQVVPSLTLLVKYNGIISMVELVKSVCYLNINVLLCIFSYFKNVKSGWYSKQLVDCIRPTFEDIRTLSSKDERIQKKLDAFAALCALQQVPTLHKEMKPIFSKHQSIVDSFLVKNLMVDNRDFVQNPRSVPDVASFHLNNLITPVNFMQLDEERPPAPSLHEPEFETQGSQLFDGEIRANQVEILRHYPDAAFCLMTKLLKSEEFKPLLSRQSDSLIAYLGISSLGQKDLTKSTLDTHETHLDQLLDLLARLLQDRRVAAKSSTTREVTNIIRRALLFYKISDLDSSLSSESDRYSFILLSKGQHDLQRQEMIRARNEKLANSKIIDAYIRLLHESSRDEEMMMAFDVLNVLLYGGNKSVQKKCLDVIFEIDKKSFPQKVVDRFRQRFFRSTCKNIEDQREAVVKAILDDEEKLGVLETPPEEAQLIGSLFGGLSKGLDEFALPVFKSSFTAESKSEIQSFFDFFKLLVAGHNQESQVYFALSDQSKNSSSSGIMTFALSSLQFFLNVYSERGSDTCLYILDLLIEMVDGPCKTNQEYLVHNSRLLLLVKGFLGQIEFSASKAPAALPGEQASIEKHLASNRKTRDIVKKMFELIHLLTEGQNDSGFLEKIYHGLHLAVLVRILKEEYIQFKNISVNEIKEKRAFGSLDESILGIRQFRQSFFIYFAVDNCLELSPRQATMMKQARLSKEESEAMGFYSKYTRFVEIDFEGDLNKVYFVQDPKCIQFESSYIHNVVEKSRSLKISQFVAEFPKFFAEVDNVQYFSFFDGAFTVSKQLDRYVDVAMYWIVVYINMRTLLWSESDIRQSQFQTDSSVLSDSTGDILVMQYVFVGACALSLVVWWLATWPFKARLRWMDELAKVQSRLQQYYVKNPDAHPQAEQQQTMKRISEEIINRPKKQKVMDILGVYCREQGWSVGFTPILYYSKLTTFMLSDGQFQYYTYNLVMAVLGKPG